MENVWELIAIVPPESMSAKFDSPKDLPQRLPRHSENGRQD
jgi:hypothetical protein